MIFSPPNVIYEKKFERKLRNDFLNFKGKRNETTTIITLFNKVNFAIINFRKIWFIFIDGEK